MNKFQTVVLVCLLAGTVGAAAACKPTSGSQSSPTEAYKSLYAAVKRKDPEGIKKVLSKATIDFMTAAAQMQKKPFDDVIANGLSESTFSPTLPQLCKERVKDNMGGLEVMRTNGQWEDLPFIKEDGQWKLAVGDLFKGTWVKPGDTICMPAQQMPSVPAPSPGANTPPNGPNVRTPGKPQTDATPLPNQSGPVAPAKPTATPASGPVKQP